MTPKEALSKILSDTPKGQVWYKTISDDCKVQTYLRITALRILNDTAKVETMKKFFEKFGYEFETVVTKKI